MKNGNFFRTERTNISHLSEEVQCGSSLTQLTKEKGELVDLMSREVFKIFENIGGLYQLNDKKALTIKAIIKETSLSTYTEIADKDHAGENATFLYYEIVKLCLDKILNKGSTRELLVDYACDLSIEEQQKRMESASSDCRSKKAFVEYQNMNDQALDSDDIYEPKRDRKAPSFFNDETGKSSHSDIDYLYMLTD